MSQGPVQSVAVIASIRLSSPRTASPIRLRVYAVSLSLSFLSLVHLLSGGQGDFRSESSAGSPHPHLSQDVPSGAQTRPGQAFLLLKSSYLPYADRGPTCTLLAAGEALTPTSPTDIVASSTQGLLH